MAFDKSLRIGAANVMMDAYGGNFASPTDLGDTSEEGITIEYSAEKKKTRSAQNITVKEIFLTSEEMTLKMALREHLVENIALGLGHDTSDVVDDAVSTPNNKSVEFGGRRTLPIKAFQMKVPQPTTPTLFDIITIYRGQLSAKFGQTYTYQGERYIELEIECLGDSANSGKLGKFVSEYA